MVSHRPKQQPQNKCRERRLASLVVRQDKFLYIAVAMLLHLAEEPSVQRKMRKKVRGGACVLSYCSHIDTQSWCAATAFTASLMKLQTNNV
jgi:hypothetical protein